MNERRMCPGCGEEKELTAEHWYKDKHRKSGRTTYCRPCQHRRRTALRHADPNQREKQREYHRAWRARKRAERLGRKEA